MSVQLTPAVSRGIADWIQARTFEQRQAFYAGLATARTENDVLALTGGAVDAEGVTHITIVPPEPAP